jgi:NAD(P)-dependent dehydrogenase (short-subunit alcohol dehydrogenase family)
MDKVWLVTGCSRGFGRSLAGAVLRKGDRLVATARDPETLRDLQDKKTLAELEQWAELSESTDVAGTLQLQGEHDMLQIGA